MVALVIGLFLALALFGAALWDSFRDPEPPSGVPTPEEARVINERIAAVEREAKEAADKRAQAIRGMTAGELVEHLKALRKKGSK